MNRNHFIKTTAAGILGVSMSSWTHRDYKNLKDTIIGHGSHRYKIDLNWGALNPNYFPVKDAHEMVQDRAGRIYLLTNHTQNNVLIYQTDGKLVGSWGHDYPGAHGLSIHDENGTEFLYICDNMRHEVIKTTLDGKPIQAFPFPMISEKYSQASQYIPTESCVAPNGDLYVADGYGEQYILHYNAKGELLHVFGGKGTEKHQFLNAHGICIDQRQGNPSLLITERQGNSLKRFDLSGNYISETKLEGAFICRPVIHNTEVYLATIWSGDGAANSGFVSILDAENKMISAPGGIAPKYRSDGTLEKMRQGIRVFKHPHDVCVDRDENLYVCQWNAGQSYPIKLVRV